MLAWICFALIVNAGAAADKTLFDFSTATNTPGWQIVNDEVMDGVSTNGFSVTNGVAMFRGEVSLENNGGFASVCSSPARQNLAGLDAVRSKNSNRAIHKDLQEGPRLPPALSAGSLSPDELETIARLYYRFG